MSYFAGGNGYICRKGSRPLRGLGSWEEGGRRKLKRRAAPIPQDAEWLRNTVLRGGDRNEPVLFGPKKKETGRQVRAE